MVKSGGGTPGSAAYAGVPKRMLLNEVGDATFPGIVNDLAALVIWWPPTPISPAPPPVSRSSMNWMVPSELVKSSTTSQVCDPPRDTGLASATAPRTARIDAVLVAFMISSVPSFYAQSVQVSKVFRGSHGTVRRAAWNCTRSGARFVRRNDRLGAPARAGYPH